MIITQINDSRVMTDYPKSGHILLSTVWHSLVSKNTLAFYTQAPMYVFMDQPPLPRGASNLEVSSLVTITLSVLFFAFYSFTCPSEIL